MGIPEWKLPSFLAGDPPAGSALSRFSSSGSFLSDMFSSDNMMPFASMGMGSTGLTESMKGLFELPEMPGALQTGLAPTGLSETLNSIFELSSVSSFANSGMGFSGLTESMKGLFELPEMPGALQTAVAPAGLTESLKSAFEFSSVGSLASAGTGLSGALDSVKGLFELPQVSTSLQDVMVTTGALDMYRNAWFELASPRLDLGTMTQLRLEVLDGIEPDGLEVILDSLLENIDPQASAAGETLTNDPVRAACWFHVLRSAEWVETQLPQYMYMADDVLNRLLAHSFHLFLLTLPPLMYQIYGWPGVIIGILIAGTAKTVRDGSRQAISLQNLSALGETCPTCLAVPQMWCVTTRGESPASPTKKLHKLRLMKSENR